MRLTRRRFIEFSGFGLAAGGRGAGPVDARTRGRARLYPAR